MPIITAAAKLRQVLQDPNSFVSAPGVYDGVSARIALSVGFDTLYMVRYASLYGERNEMKLSIYARPELVPPPRYMGKQTWASAR